MHTHTGRRCTHLEITPGLPACPDQSQGNKVKAAKQATEPPPVLALELPNSKPTTVNAFHQPVASTPHPQQTPSPSPQKEKFKGKDT